MAAFARLVSALRRAGRKVAVVESSCGGQVQAGIMGVPGASAAFVGGSCVYDTRAGRELLLNDAALHDALVGASQPSSAAPVMEPPPEPPTAAAYVARKREWARLAATRYASVADVAIGEAGALGPTFRPPDLDRGFTALCVADRTRGVLAERLVWAAPDADRAASMRAFAEAAADLAATAVEESGLDRATKERDALPSEDDSAVVPSGDDFLTAARVIVLDRQTTSRALFDAAQPERLALLSPREILDRDPAAAKSSSTWCFLGRFANAPGAPAVWSVCADVAAASSDDTLAERAESSERVAWGSARTRLAGLDRAHRDLLLHAVALQQWHRREPFCSACGAATVAHRGGSVRQCTNVESCGAAFFPRQDPSIIVVVKSRDGSRCLLGRSPRHPRGVYTALAGFVEAGETLEDAVAREVREETGVRVDASTIEYVASQPWPFPRSAMVGFVATAARGHDTDESVVVDRDELDDAKWFDRRDVARAAAVSSRHPTTDIVLRGRHDTASVMDAATAEALLEAHPDAACLVPPPGILARILIDHYLAEESPSSSSG